MVYKTVRVFFFKTWIIYSREVNFTICELNLDKAVTKDLETVFENNGKKFQLNIPKGQKGGTGFKKKLKLSAMFYKFRDKDHFNKLFKLIKDILQVGIFPR